MVQHIHVETIKQAWEQADKLFPTDYIKDEQSSKNAGYPVFRSTAKSLPNAFYNTISDLGNRLEVNLVDKNWNGRTVNIWIDFIERTTKGFRVCSAD